MKNSNTLNAISAAVLATLAFSAPAQSEVKSWNMCDWQLIPGTVLNRIENRADYDDILRRMFENCPESALALTDRPTATVQTRVEGGDRQGGGDEDDDGDDGDEGGGDGGGGEGPGGLPG